MSSAYVRRYSPTLLEVGEAAMSVDGHDTGGPGPDTHAHIEDGGQADTDTEKRCRP